MQRSLSPCGALTLALAGLAVLSSSLLAQPYGYPQQGQYSYPQGQGYPQYQQAPQYQQPQYQGGYAQQPQYVSPMQFLPTFGRRFGEMFRRVFYGDAPSAQPYYPPQGQGRLDQPPQGAPGVQQPYYQPLPGQAPRYETAPPQRGTVPAMPPTSRMNSGTAQPAPAQKKNATSGTSGSSKKSSTPPPSTTPPENYRPPAITRDTPPSPPAMVETPPLGSGRPQQLPGSKPADTGVAPSKEPTATVGSGSFLRGKKAGKPGRVISPYPPYRELDVTGLASGSLALDPTTQKVFEVP